MPRPSITVMAGALVAALVPLAAKAQGQSAGLPEGPGREAVEGTCTGCHQANQITRSSGYTAEDWQELIGTMIDLSGSPEDRAAIVGYLAATFPRMATRAPKLLPGEAHDRLLTEWRVPQPRASGRATPVEAPGRLDRGGRGQCGQPCSGARSTPRRDARDIRCPTVPCRTPSTLDAAGHAWYDRQQERHDRQAADADEPARGCGAVARRPVAGAHAPPGRPGVDGAYGGVGRERHFLLVHPAAEQHGRAPDRRRVPEVRLVTRTRRMPRRYGIEIDANGMPWVACNGSNCLVRATRRPWR